MNAILTLKHWQLFCLYLGMWVLGWILQSLLGLKHFSYVWSFPLFLSYAFFTHWLLAAALRLHSLIPPQIEMNLLAFKWIALLPLLFQVLLNLLFALFISDKRHGDQGTVIVLAYLLLLPFCCIWAWLFLAQSIAIVRRQREVGLDDYIGWFIMIFFFPLGVWVLQPTIQELLQGEQPAQEQVYTGEPPLHSNEL